MKETLLAIITLLSLNYAFSQAAFKESNILLIKDNIGYYINTHIKNTTTNYTQTVPLMLDLSASYDIFVESCMGFSKYNCNDYSCTPISAQYNITDLYFSLLGSEIQSVKSLDGHNWDSLRSTLLASSCISNNIGYGLARYGSLGFGYDPNSTPSYPVFSIYINKNSPHGSLILGVDEKLKQESNLVVSFKAEKGWIVPGEFEAFIGDSPFLFDATLAFDVNADAIGIPLGAYYEFISAIAGIIGSSESCTQDNYFPICEFSGKISDLPNITATNGNTVITIPPQVYVQNGYNTQEVNTIVLNVKAIGSVLTGRGYVSEEFSSTMILDSNFMTYYYTVFNQTETPQISFYVANHSLQERNEDRKSLLNRKQETEPSLLSF